MKKNCCDLATLLAHVCLHRCCQGRGVKTADSLGAAAICFCFTFFTQLLLVEKIKLKQVIKLYIATLLCELGIYPINWTNRLSVSKVRYLPKLYYFSFSAVLNLLSCVELSWFFGNIGRFYGIIGFIKWQ